LRLDFREEDSVGRCVDTVLDQAGRLDVLVNNAGYSLAGALEEATVDQVRALFETNFFGVARMVKAVLPHMRERGKGHIVNISSGMALARAPFLGFYTASKCALEAYSETLWHELRPLNVAVSLIEPGFVRTSIEDNSSEGADRIADYGRWRERALDCFRGAVKKGADPASVADCVARVVTSRSPSLVYVVGKDALGLPLLRRILPGPAFRSLMRRFVGVNGAGADQDAKR
jgi:NAD(P)-dependent dehydrogenase (short-subunit alcohol dehydrogenase family)